MRAALLGLSMVPGALPLPLLHPLGLGRVRSGPLALCAGGDCRKDVIGHGCVRDVRLENAREGAGGRRDGWGRRRFARRRRRWGSGARRWARRVLVELERLHGDVRAVLV